MSNTTAAASSPLPLVLAIDTSCDETSAAVTLGPVVLSNVIASQTSIHQPYGGVFPTLAKQAHQVNIRPTINKALKLAQVQPVMLDAVAVTTGPGLAPALEVGIEHAVKLSQQWHKPLLGINHLEAHLLSVLASRAKKNLTIKKMLTLKTNQQKVPVSLARQFAVTNELHFPVLGLILSGGHTQLVQVDGIGQYRILGETIDDALGEALDKVGRLLGLGYPAGPVIEQLAKLGNPQAYDWPLPMTTSGDFNLSYSGLKTAAHRLIKKIEAAGQLGLSKQETFDLTASFQEAAFRHLCYKLEKLLESQAADVFKAAWLGGGVAANIFLRRKLRQLLKRYNLQLLTPFEKRLCGDNAAMIGVTAGLRVESGLEELLPNSASNPASLDRKPSWSLEQL